MFLNKTWRIMMRVKVFWLIKERSADSSSRFPKNFPLFCSSSASVQFSYIKDKSYTCDSNIIK